MPQKKFPKTIQQRVTQRAYEALANLADALEMNQCAVASELILEGVERRMKELRNAAKRWHGAK